ncbi:NUDIX domain-containing protein [Nonomuraea ceibae]|uniref:NUDIX domain-containing protein n=1 Tax=Nonomuraea ceibae TaxID=1935170 RepID=UPI001C5EAD2A|nr:NUDIX hydrolase [Nonomuraea ceibae]
MNPSDADQQRTFVEPEIYYAQLAAVHVATGALIIDPAGRVLVVKPFYRPHWQLPGGMADEGEPPEVACARELDEELGLRVEVGRLLVVDWAPPSGHRARPLMYLVFDAGTMDEPDLRLQHAELDDATFFPPEEAAARLAEADAARVPAALAAREHSTTVYRPSSG